MVCSLHPSSDVIGHGPLVAYVTTTREDSSLTMEQTASNRSFASKDLLSSPAVGDAAHG